MARTSKTKIGGGEGAQAERMMRADDTTGQQRAHSEVLNTYRSGAAQAGQMARDVGNVFNEGENRKQRGEQFDESMAQRDRQFTSSQEQQASQFNRQQAGQEDRTNLEAAKAGFEKGDSRSAQLDKEMGKGQGQEFVGPMPPGEERPGPLDPESQQRLQEQGQKPMEMDSSGKWRPTAERQANTEREQKRADFSADTERMRAMAYRDQVGVSAQKALASGDKEAYKKDVQRLVALPNDRQKQFDRLMKDDPRPTDFPELKKLAAGSEMADPSLMADIDKGIMTPRIGAFLRAQVAKDALQSVVLSKGSTDMLEVDWTNPQMIAFQDTRNNINSFMKANPALAQLGFIKSTEDKMRFLNVLAASQVVMGLNRAPSSPAGGMMPSTDPMQQQQGGGAGAPPMVGQTQGTPRPGAPDAGTQAVQDARAGGASPQDALQAGQDVDPTAGRKMPARPTYAETRRSGL